jgi:hypothetical protein
MASALTDSCSPADLYVRFSGETIPGEITHRELSTAYIFQLRLSFIAFHCLLSARDAKAVAVWLIRERFLQQGHRLQPESLLDMVTRALDRYPVQFEQTLINGDLLNDIIATDTGYLTIERSISDCWMTLVVPTPALDQKAIGYRMESCYLDNTIDHMRPFVFLSRREIRRKNTPVLLAFDVEPTIEMVRAGVVAIEERLRQHGFEGRLRWTTVTSPIRYQDHVTPEQPLYRSDGRVCPDKWEKVFSTRLTTATRLNMTLETGWQIPHAPAVEWTPPVPIPQQPAEQTHFQTLVLYLRVSSDDQLHFGDSLSRQLLYSISQLPQTVAGVQRIRVVGECTSSSSYAWQTRTMWPRLQRELRRDQQPIMLITASPERLTRRSQDLQRIQADFQALGITWYSYDMSDEEPDLLEEMNADNLANVVQVLDHRMVCGLSTVIATLWPTF